MEKKVYKATEGKIFRRKSDGHIMGNTMVLGRLVNGEMNTIDNYEEVEDTIPAEVRERMKVRGRRFNPHRPSLRKVK